jgi:hypothetical protein
VHVGLVASVVGYAVAFARFACVVVPEVVVVFVVSSVVVVVVVVAHVVLVADFVVLVSSVVASVRFASVAVACVESDVAPVVATDVYRVAYVLLLDVCAAVVAVLAAGLRVRLRRWRGIVGRGI